MTLVDTPRKRRTGEKCATVLSVTLSLLTLIFCIVLPSDESSLYFFSVVSLIEMAISLFIWWLAKKEVFAPFPIIISCLFLFNLGQTVLWVFKLDYYLDVIKEGEHESGTIVSAIKFLLMCLDCFLVGGLLHRNQNNRATRKVDKLEEKKLFFTCLFVAFLSVVPYILWLYNSISTSVNKGYAYIYSAEYQSTVNAFSTIIANLFEPALLGMIASSKKKPDLRRLLIIFCALLALIKFVIGGRAAGVAMFISLMLIFYFDGGKITFKRFVVLLLLGTSILILISITQTLRTQTGRSLSDYLKAFGNSDNVLVSIFGEFGWSISPTLYTMELVPAFYPYRFGSTYVVSLLSIVPNLGFWEVHPAEKYASLTNWVTNAANHGWSGVGFSSTAEAYINFSWAGCLLFVAWGYFIYRIIYNCKMAKGKKPVFNFLVLSSFLCLFYSFVRGDFRDMFRAFSWRILPIVVLYYAIGLILKPKRSENEKSVSSFS